MPVEGKYSGWISSTISSGTSTDEIDLTATFDRLVVMVPTIASGTITVHISDATGGTYYPLYALDSASAADFARVTTSETATKAVVFDIGGTRYIKVVFGASQTALTVLVQGSR